METISTKFFTALLLTVFGGGWTLPVGLPPAPEEPAVARVAPEKCLFYVRWAGMAAPDAKSKNKTEQLLAEPEVQRSFTALTALMSKMTLPDLADYAKYGAAPPTAPPQPAATNNNGHEDAVGQAAIDFIKIVAMHPAAIFVSEIKNNKEGFDNLQIVRGGMIVAAGQDAGKLRAAFEQLLKEATAPEPVTTASAASKSPAKTTPTVRAVQIAGHTWHRFTDSTLGPPVTYGFQDSNFILVAGDGGVEEILRRRGQKPPAWLIDLQKRSAVERPSMIAYLNIKRVLDQVVTDKAMPRTKKALHRLGLDQLLTLSSVSGLDGEMFTSRLSLTTDGEPQGLMTMFSDRPLRAEDLKPIPRDATLAVAMRVDLQKAVDTLATLGEAFGLTPPSVAQPAPNALMKALEVDFRRDLPKALGDTCCVYSSPSEGGLAVLGLTAVMPIRDRDAVSVIQAKFLGSSLAQRIGDEFSSISSGAVVDQSVSLHTCSFAGQRIFYLATGIGIAPAWCATERELIIAMTPQNVMAYLQHGPGSQSVAAIPQVRQAIQGGNGPSMLVYVDTAKLFELAYPLMPLVLSELGECGEFPLDLLPPAPSINRHLLPGTAALRRTKQGLELTSRQPLPGTGLLWTAAALWESPKSLEDEVADEERSTSGRGPLRARAVNVEPYVAPQDPAAPRLPPPYDPSAPEGSGAAPSAIDTYAGTTYPAPAMPAGAPPALGPTGTTYMPGMAGAATSVPSAAAPATPPPYMGPYGPPAVGPLPPRAYPSAVPLAQPALGHLFDIGAGVKAYRNKHRRMPPAYLADKQGKPLLSWRVALLPCLGQQALYKRFHLGEPWDSPHNRELIALIPEAYQDGPDVIATFAPPAKSPLAKDAAGKTRFLLLRGPKTVYATVTPPMPGTYEEWLKIIVVQVIPERAVPWTKPEDFTYDAKDPGAGIERKSGADFMMLEAGSVVPALSLLDLADTSPAAKERERDVLRHRFTGEEPAVSRYAPFPLPPQ